MRILFLLILLTATGLLSSCAAQPASQNATVDPDSQRLIKRLQTELPGSYSTYTQVQGGAAGKPVTDLTIRPLYGAGEPVFLFESQVRNSMSPDYDVYWIKQDSQSGQTDLYFTRLTGSELSLPLQQTLDIAWRRVLPGCAMPLSANGQRIDANTRPATCRFENPLQGETRLYRGLSLSPAGLQLETISLTPGEKLVTGGSQLRLLKLRVYQGQVRVGTLDPATGQYGDWQSSLPFNIRDDGRTVNLYDEAAKPMPFTVQLARLHWRDGEPPYWKLTVFNAQTGIIQAFKWFKDDAKPMGMELDWFRVELKLKAPETEAGER